MFWLKNNMKIRVTFSNFSIPALGTITMSDEEYRKVYGENESLRKAVGSNIIEASQKKPKGK